MRLVGVPAVIAACLVGVVASACGQPREPERPGTAVVGSPVVSRGAPSQAPGLLAGSARPAPACPVVTGGAGSVSVDYVDFVNVGGRQYIAGLRPVPPLDPSDLGRVVLRVRCSFSELNARTHAEPPKPADGDAGFLRPGTPVREVRGWPVRCRVAAVTEGATRVYLAIREGGTTAAPEPCALKR